MTLASGAVDEVACPTRGMPVLVGCEARSGKSFVAEVRIVAHSAVSSETPLLPRVSDAAACFEDRDEWVTLPAGFPLDVGALTHPAFVRARLVGPKDAPVVLVLGGISANRHVCDSPDGPSGWWRELTTTDRALSPTRYRLLSFDFFPGNAQPQGAEELSAPNNLSLSAQVSDAPPINPVDSVSLAFVTSRDQARVAEQVCEHFGIPVLHALIGASYGGMVALQFSALFPQRVQRLLVACAAHRPHPMGTAWRSIQRKIVRFGLETQQPDRALSLARELGMTTYRTATEFGERFGPSTLSQTPDALSSDVSLSQGEVETYLETRGQAFIGRMTPERYLLLSQSIDLHTVDPATISVPITLVACRQDQLVPIEEVQRLHEALPASGEFLAFDSIYGHDAFLKEVTLVSDTIHRILQA
jgi:homoserine O-acetyltransferase